MLAPLSKRPVTPSVETPVASFSPTWRQRVYVDLLVDRLHRGQCTRDTSIAPFLGLRPEAISR